MVSAGAMEGPSPPTLPREFWWMRRVVDHPVASAVVYAACAAMWALHGGLALWVLGRRTGGAAGARVASAGISAACAAIWPFVLLAPVAPILFGLQAAVLAIESDDPPALKRRPAASTGELVRAVLGYLVKDVTKLASCLLVYLALIGCWMVKLSTRKGSFQEKAGEFMLDTGILGVAVIHSFCVCPSWVRDWRTGQLRCVGQKH